SLTDRSPLRSTFRICSRTGSPSALNRSATRASSSGLMMGLAIHPPTMKLPEYTVGSPRADDRGQRSRAATERPSDCPRTADLACTASRRPLPTPRLAVLRRRPTAAHSGTAAPRDARPAQHPLQRAEPGEARLEQVEADERGEQEPALVHPPAEREGEQD